MLPRQTKRIETFAIATFLPRHWLAQAQMELFDAEIQHEQKCHCQQHHMENQGKHLRREPWNR